VYPDDEVGSVSRWPACVGTALRVDLEVEDALAVVLQEKARARTPPAGTKIAREVASGADYSVSREKWVRLYRLVDRAGDAYEELVVDEETGEVLRSCVEPLSAHQGRGSAKPSPAPLTST
jgi:hypothetical protein